MVGAWVRVMVVVPVQLTLESGATFCLFKTVLLSSTTTLGALAKVNTVFTPFTTPADGTRTLNEPPPPVTFTFAWPPPPLVTVAPAVKSMVVTFTTGVMPSVTVNGLPPPEPPAPVISIRFLLE